MVHTLFEITFYSINNDFPNRIWKFIDCISVDNVEAGMFGYMDDAICCHDRLYKFVAGAPTDKKQIIVMAHPTIPYDDIISASTPFRVYIPRENGAIMVNDIAFEENSRKFVNDIDTDTTKVFITVGDNGKLVASSNYTNDSIGYISAKISKH